MNITHMVLYTFIQKVAPILKCQKNIEKNKMFFSKIAHFFFNSQ